MQELDVVFVRAKAQVEPQVQSDYAKYLVVRVSGLVEDVVTTIILQYVEQRASTDVASHIEWRMKLFQNPELERLSQLIGSFSPSARARFLDQLTDAEREALRSVRDRRNEVAHGGQSVISLGQVDQYYGHIKTLLAKIADVLA